MEILLSALRKQRTCASRIVAAQRESATVRSYLTGLALTEKSVWNNVVAVVEESRLASCRKVRGPCAALAMSLKHARCCMKPDFDIVNEDATTPFLSSTAPQMTLMARLSTLLCQSYGDRW